MSKKEKVKFSELFIIVFIILATVKGLKAYPYTLNILVDNSGSSQNNNLYETYTRKVFNLIASVVNEKNMWKNIKKCAIIGDSCSDENNFVTKIRVFTFEESGYGNITEVGIIDFTSNIWRHTPSGRLIQIFSSQLNSIYNKLKTAPMVSNSFIGASIIRLLYTIKNSDRKKKVLLVIFSDMNEFVKTARNSTLEVYKLSRSSINSYLSGFLGRSRRYSINNLSTFITPIRSFVVENLSCIINFGMYRGLALTPEEQNKLNYFWQRFFSDYLWGEKLNFITVPEIDSTTKLIETCGGEK